MKEHIIGELRESEILIDLTSIERVKLQKSRIEESGSKERFRREKRSVRKNKRIAWLMI